MSHIEADYFYYIMKGISHADIASSQPFPLLSFSKRLSLHDLLSSWGIEIKKGSTVSVRKGLLSAKSSYGDRIKSFQQLVTIKKCDILIDLCTVYEEIYGWELYDDYLIGSSSFELILDWVSIAISNEVYNKRFTEKINLRLVTGIAYENSSDIGEFTEYAPIIPGSPIDIWEMLSA